MAISPVGMANMGYWGILPMGISNYGGDVQVYNVPNYASSNLFSVYNPIAMQSYLYQLWGLDVKYHKYHLISVFNHRELS